MLKLDMRLGVASSATQIEGGDVQHSWSAWHPDVSRANDHWNRWREDIDLMAAMGITVYRLGIEWARLEPNPGMFDPVAAGRYRELLIYMKSKGIEPLLTLHHFTNPLWFEQAGGFLNPKNIAPFMRYIEYAIRTFGDLVDEYITVNEPNVCAYMGYYSGVFPPGLKSMRKTFRVQSVMASCHVRAYRLIHKLRRDMGHTGTKVGFAHHARVFVPMNPGNPWHRWCTRIVERFFQGALVAACLRGRFKFPLKKFGKFPTGEYADFHGLNYYTRTAVSGLRDGTRPGAPVNELGWEIYPDGIVQCARELHAALPRPIYITENGTCDNSDAFRSRYIYEHLKALAESGLPVERYYHWCFTDNFEWAEGETARFGLVHVDFDTQVRRIKKSGCFYAAMIAMGCVTDEMVKEYVTGTEYPTG